MRRIIGIIGCGNMGEAIAKQLLSKYKILIFDKDSQKTNGLKGVENEATAVDLVNKVDTIILAVKPQDVEDLLTEIKNFILDKLVVSIAAGITTDYIEKYLGNVRVVRVMPNLPAKIGLGMTCLCKGKLSTNEELNFTKELFSMIGETLILNEDMMDEATAISGSGPGFLYDLSENKGLDEIKKFAEDIFIPSLVSAAVSIGFSLEQAMILAKTTTKGSIILLKKTKLSPLELKKQVASKGGTTEAGLEILHKGGSLEEAVKAALKRSKELARS
ncbi:MAG: pyrroline-5-carboxylate reductase [Candidatus Omnitrophota bacterium]|nr:pyrroline-5-carboxylate reductase [Candidatus Omnitrophota bacterium]